MATACTILADIRGPKAEISVKLSSSLGLTPIEVLVRGHVWNISLVRAPGFIQASIDSYCDDDTAGHIFYFALVDACEANADFILYFTLIGFGRAKAALHLPFPPQKHS